MKFRVLGHACLEVSCGGTQLLCDPWLVGSSYWRSWWNYPPVPEGLVDGLEPDFIYITHLHWDHFHAPTLRRLGLDRHILIPRTPDRRMRDDLIEMGCTRITELEHGKAFQIAPGFRVTSYQFGHFPDSVLMIDADNKTLMNANDCKIMGYPLQQVLKQHPTIDFAFRSHSSANARLCFEITDRGGIHTDNPDKYSAEFADFARAVGARYAIPFASNNCYLHPETTQFNRYLNLGIYVKRYFETHSIREPECVVCAPGDGWDDATGFSLSEKDWYTDIDAHLAAYAAEKAEVLKRTSDREARAALTDKILAPYANGLMKGTPFPLRRLFKNKPITLVARGSTGETAFELDIYKRKWRKLDQWNDEDNPIQIHANAAVFIMCIRQVNWSSLGISKRVRFRVKEADRNIITYFNELNDLFDCEVLPLSKSLNSRFAAVWLRRWRELALYSSIATDLARGREFDYHKYLPISRPSYDLRRSGQS